MNSLGVSFMVRDAGGYKTSVGYNMGLLSGALTTIDGGPVFGGFPVENNNMPHLRRGLTRVMWVNSMRCAISDFITNGPDC